MEVAVADIGPRLRTVSSLFDVAVDDDVVVVKATPRDQAVEYVVVGNSSANTRKA